MLTTLGLIVIVAILTFIVTSAFVEDRAEARFRRHVANLESENERLVIANTHHYTQCRRIADRYHTLCDVAEASREWYPKDWAKLEDAITDKIFEIETRDPSDS